MSERRHRESVPLKDRSRKEKLEAHRILHERKVGGQSVYDPRVHPDGLIDYFREFLEDLEDKEVERVKTKHGDVKYVQAPLSPPLLSGYAVKIGVARETLWEWTKKYPEFDQAVKIAKAIQEKVFLEMGAMGAWNPRIVELMMKNLQEWRDKVDLEHGGTVILNFDAQDKEC